VAGGGVLVLILLDNLVLGVVPCGFYSVLASHPSEGGLYLCRFALAETVHVSEDATIFAINPWPAASRLSIVSLLRPRVLALRNNTAKREMEKIGIVFQ
jgi:hypothetical protein